MDPKYDPHNRFQQRFDPTVDAIIRRGYVIARQFVSELKTAHVLLSALEEPRAVEVIQMFATPPIDLDRLRAALEARADCEDRYFSEERPTAQSAYCVQALKHAFEESARRGRQDAIGVPHLLYGLARQTTETTGALLNQCGVTADRMRSWIDGGCKPRQNRKTAQQDATVSSSAMTKVLAQLKQQADRIKQIERELASMRGRRTAAVNAPQLASPNQG